MPPRAASAPKLSPIKPLQKNNTGNFRAALVYRNESGACRVDNEFLPATALRCPCWGIKLATSSTQFSMKLFIFLPGLIQLGAKERGKMRRPQGSIESLNLFIFSLRNDGNPRSKPPQQPASLHPHGNSGLWTNTLHAISFLPPPLLQRHLSFSVRCARDRHPTTSAQKDLKHPLSSAPLHFQRLTRAKVRKSRRQLNGAFPR